MLLLHGRDNVIEFVLHELCHEQCFNLEKAAYVVDNPDFNCLKGVAGFARSEAYEKEADVWKNPDAFSAHMQSSPFNQKVRSFEKESLCKKGASDDAIVSEVAQNLGLDHPSYYAWDMKHDNRGVLVYQKCDQEECDCNYLLDGLCMLGFCPVF